MFALNSTQGRCWEPTDERVDPQLQALAPQTPTPTTTPYTRTPEPERLGTQASASIAHGGSSKNLALALAEEARRSAVGETKMGDEGETAMGDEGETTMASNASTVSTRAPSVPVSTLPRAVSSAGEHQASHAANAMSTSNAFHGVGIQGYLAHNAMSTRDESAGDWYGAGALALAEEARRKKVVHITSPLLRLEWITGKIQLCS